MTKSSLVLVLATLPPAALRNRLEIIRDRYPDGRLGVLSATGESYGPEVETFSTPGPYIGAFRGWGSLTRIRRTGVGRVIVPYAVDGARGYLNAHLAAFLVGPGACFGMGKSGEENRITMGTLLAGGIRSAISLIWLAVFAGRIVSLVVRGRLTRRPHPEAEEKCLILLSYYFPPQGGPAVQRPLSFVRHLPGHGWCPIILAGEVVEAIGIDETLAAGVGSDVTIFRPGSPGGSDRWTGRFRDLPRPLRHVPDQYLGWIVWTMRMALSPEVIRRNPRAIMATAPPYSSFIAARALSAATGLPLVLDYRDSWTVEGPEKNYTGLSRRVEEKLERWVLSGEGRVTVVVRRFKRYLRELKPDLESRRLLWLPNGYEPDDFRGLKPLRPEDRETVLYYMGSFFGRRSPEAFFRAFAELLSRRADLKERVTLAFAGRDSDGVTGWAAAHGLAGNVITLGYLDHGTALSYLLGSDGALLLVNENLPAMVSGKVHEYMAAGKPVLLVGPPEGEAAALIRRYGRGLVVSASAGAGVAVALERFIDGFSELAVRPVSSFHQAFERARIAGRLARLLDSL